MSDSPVTERTPRPVAALEAVLPPGAVLVASKGAEHEGVQVTINDVRARLAWIGEGWPASARKALDAAPGPDGAPLVLVARRMSPGARALAIEAGVGWVDESGAAEIALRGLVVARTGAADRGGPVRWRPSTLAVAEALLTGTKARVAATAAATGLAVGSCAGARALPAAGGTALRPRPPRAWLAAQRRRPDGTA